MGGTLTRPAGDLEALYLEHRLALTRLALLLVDDLPSAEDVVQDAFANLHRRWSSVRDNPVAYLRTSVVNGSRSALRHRRTVRTTYLPQDQDGPGADADVLVAEEHRAVLAALDRLPARQREVIVLRYWAELTEAEIAATLGISVGAVKSSASRGRDAIAALLEEQR